MRTISVTTWSLEQTSVTQLSAARPSADSSVTITRAQVPSPEFSRFLYSAVGADITWTDRLGWDYARWLELLERPGTETWVAYDRGAPAGFVELVAQPQGVVEISYFGLLPAFRGRGFGGQLLTYATARAWDLAERWPGVEATTRVWLHTCSKDGPHALANYQRRGFQVFDVKVEEEPFVPTPGPWPGAFAQLPPAADTTDRADDSASNSA